MEIWPNPDKISALVSGVMGKQFKMNIYVLGEELFITNFMGNNPNQTMPQTFPNKYLWVSTPKNNCSGDNTIEYQGPCAKNKNLHPCPFTVRPAPSRCVTLHHAPSRGSDK